MNTFGARLRQARLDCALTQEGLAFDLGVSKASVSAWETDRDFPRMQHLEPLRMLLGVDLDFLICNSVAKARSIGKNTGVRETAAAYAGAGEHWLSARETRLLFAWRAMPIERQDALLVLLQSNRQGSDKNALNAPAKKPRAIREVKKRAVKSGSAG